MKCRVPMNCKCGEGTMMSLGLGPTPDPNTKCEINWCSICGRIFRAPQGKDHTVVGRWDTPGTEQKIKELEAAVTDARSFTQLAHLINAMNSAENRGVPIKELLKAFQTIQTEWAKWIERFEKLAVHSEGMKRKLEARLEKINELAHDLGGSVGQDIRSLSLLEESQ